MCVVRVLTVKVVAAASRRRAVRVDGIMRALLRLWRAGGGAGAGTGARAGAEAQSHHSRHGRAAARILASSTAHHHHSTR